MRTVLSEDSIQKLPRHCGQHPASRIQRLRFHGSPHLKDFGIIYIYIQVSGFFEHSKNIQSQTLQSVNDLFGVHSRAHAHHTKTLKFDPVIFSPFIL